MSLAAVIISCSFFHQHSRSDMAERFGAPDRGTALGGVHIFEEQDMSLLKKILFA